jgi:hypothetical protein
VRKRTQGFEVAGLGGLLILREKIRPVTVATWCSRRAPRRQMAQPLLTP